MNVDIVGLVLEFIGTIMIAYTVMRVHYRVWKEHALDNKVFRAMKREQGIGVLGVLFVAAGFLLQLVGKV